MRETRSVRLHNPRDLHKPLGYSHVAESISGRLIFIAGQVALDGDGNLQGNGDFGAQTRQVFANIAGALAAARATFQDVVRLNCYCVDSVDLSVQLPVFREVRDNFVNTAAPPASTFVVVRRLVHPDWLIEVEAVAIGPT